MQDVVGTEGRGKGMVKGECMVRARGWVRVGRGEGRGYAMESLAWVQGVAMGAGLQEGHHDGVKGVLRSW